MLCKIKAECNLFTVFTSPCLNILYTVMCFTKWWTLSRSWLWVFWECPLQTQSLYYRTLTMNLLTCKPVYLGFFFWFSRMFRTRTWHLWCFSLRIAWDVWVPLMNVGAICPLECQWEHKGPRPCTSFQFPNCDQNTFFFFPWEFYGT